MLDVPAYVPPVVIVSIATLTCGRCCHQNAFPEAPAPLYSFFPTQSVVVHIQMAETRPKEHERLEKCDLAFWRRRWKTGSASHQDHVAGKPLSKGKSFRFQKFPKQPRCTSYEIKYGNDPTCLQRNGASDGRFSSVEGLTM